MLSRTSLFITISRNTNTQRSTMISGSKLTSHTSVTRAKSISNLNLIVKQLKRSSKRRLTIRILECKTLHLHKIHQLSSLMDKKRQRKVKKETQLRGQLTRFHFQESNKSSLPSMITLSSLLLHIQLISHMMSFQDILLESNKLIVQLKEKRLPRT